jgi:hypothetical protein
MRTKNLYLAGGEFVSAQVRAQHGIVVINGFIFPTHFALQW